MRLLFFIISICAVCVGCDSKEECMDILSSKGENVDTICNMTFNLKNPKEIRVWCKSVFSFEAMGLGKFTIESKNTEIAKVSVRGNRFTIRTCQAGTTDIIIANDLGKSIVLKCYSCSFANVWAELPELSSIYNNSVMVVAEDQLVANKIRKELGQCLLKRNKYIFAEGTNRVSVVYDNGEAIEGDYLWNVETQTLLLNFEGKTERYICDLQPEFPNLSLQNPRFIIALQQNFTTEYAIKYPKAGIKDIYTIHYIIALDDYWLTKK